MHSKALLKAAGVLSTLVVVSALASGCSSQASGSGSDSGGKATGTITVLFPQTHAGASKVLQKGFEKANPGTKVNVTLVPYQDIEQKATLDVQSGSDQFDVIDGWYTGIGSMAKSKVIAPVDDLVKEAHPDDFIKSIYDAYSLVGDKRYSVPFDGDSEVLFYNKEILDRNGITPPKTWDEYNADVAKITAAEKANGIYGAAVMGQQTPIILMSTYANRLAGYGGSFLDKSGKPTLDTPAAIDAAKALQDVVPNAMPTPLETDFDKALKAFLNGKVAFMEFWTDLGTYSQDPSQSKIVGKWGVEQLPVGGTNTHSKAALDAGFAMMLSEGSKNKDLAKKFILYATSHDTNLQLITTTGSGIDPTRLSTLESPKYKEFTPQVQAAATVSLNGALAWPTNPQAPQLFQKLTDALAQMITNNGDPAQTMKKVQSEWESILG